MRRWSPGVLGLACVACDAPELPSPTYSEDVAPLLGASCVGCHRRDGAAPFPLETYADAAPNAARIADAVKQGRMPPWPPDHREGDCPPLVGAPALAPEARAVFEGWASSDAPEGEPSLGPAPGEPPARWIDDADVDLAPAEPFTPAAADDWRCFILDPGRDADSFITAYAVEAGRGVHHVQLWELEDDAATETARAMDADDPGAGFECLAWPFSVPARYLSVWGPSDPVRRHPAGTGVRLRAGRELVMQVHYHHATGAHRTRIALALEDRVDAEAEMMVAAAPWFVLPPRQSSVPVSAERAVDQAVRLWGVRAHMHALGRSAYVTLRSGDTSRCLLSIPRWDAAWQLMYFFDAPIDVAPGDRFEITCMYDTTSRSVEVAAGATADDEMCFSYFFVSP